MERGNCENITNLVVAQAKRSNSTILNLLRNAPNTPQKNTADVRYLWPSVVFEKICMCHKHFGGVDCNECNFGWTGPDCSMRKTPVVRKSFARLTEGEQKTFVSATQQLKNELGVWSVVVEEPPTYSTGHVTLQNISTYDFFYILT